MSLSKEVPRFMETSNCWPCPPEPISRTYFQTGEISPDL